SLAPVPRDLSFSDGGWKSNDPKARVELLGGKNALRLTTGMSVRHDVDLQDGTLEFDLWSTGERAFAYLHFRMQTEDESEAIYFRLHKSRLPDAVQYEPIYQGLSNWQLFHGPDATAMTEIRPNAWIHVRLVLSGEKAALFLGNDPKPILAIPKLMRGAKGGFIALRSFLGNNVKGDVEPPSSFANVVVKAGVIDYDFSKVVEAPPPALPGLVRQWQLSPAFEPAVGAVMTLPSVSAPRDAWTSASALPSGLIVISREIKAPKARRYGTVASFHVRAAEAGMKKMKLGFSDEASVFLNGQIFFSGDQHYSFNFPRQEGLITLDQAAIYLPLKKGDNEISIVISEVFGGWGVMAQFEDPTGLSIEP
ncbi:MAG: hypothetical protein ABIR28_02510, partial [Vicinamibacteria bacterium]